MYIYMGLVIFSYERSDEFHLWGSDDFQL
jgi:hypothetical protein